MLPGTDLRHGQLLIQTHFYMKQEEYGRTEHEDENNHLERTQREFI